MIFAYPNGFSPLSRGFPSPCYFCRRHTPHPRAVAIGKGVLQSPLPQTYPTACPGKVWHPNPCEMWTSCPRGSKSPHHCTFGHSWSLVFAGSLNSIISGKKEQNISLSTSTITVVMLAEHEDLDDSPFGQLSGHGNQLGCRVAPGQWMGHCQPQKTDKFQPGSTCFPKPISSWKRSWFVVCFVFFFFPFPLLLHS